MTTATLHVTGGPAAGTTITVEAEPLLIGRAAGSESAGALGDDPELSREHARISVSDGVLVIEDLGSRNGTFVNGKRIEASTELQAGDRIKVGSYDADVRAARPGPDGGPAEEAGSGGRRVGRP